MRNPMLRAKLHDDIRSGADGSAEELYRLVLDLVRGQTRRATAWGADPDDLAHDIFVAVFDAIQGGAVRSPDRLAAYILGTAQRQVCGSLRQFTARRVVAVEDASRLPGREPDPEQSLSSGETRRHLDRLLRHLPETDQAILRRFYIGEVPWQTIAEDLRLTPTQFRLRKHRALERMRWLAAERNTAE